MNLAHFMVYLLSLFYFGTGLYIFFCFVGLYSLAGALMGVAAWQLAFTLWTVAKETPMAIEEKTPPSSRCSPFTVNLIITVSQLLPMTLLAYSDSRSLASHGYFTPKSSYKIAKLMILLQCVFLTASASLALVSLAKIALYLKSEKAFINWSNLMAFVTIFIAIFLEGLTEYLKVQRPSMLWELACAAMGLLGQCAMVAVLWNLAEPKRE